MNIKIVNKSNNPYPRYETSGSAGMDLRANNPNEYDILLYPGEQRIISTGLYMEIPEGFQGEIRPRSGMAANHSVTVTNTPGTIDSDYRGEIKVILINLGKVPYIVAHSARIAQIVFMPYERAHFDRVETLSETDRGEGGYGSTGNK